MTPCTPPTILRVVLLLPLVLTSAQGPLQTWEAVLESAKAQLTAGGPVNLRLAPSTFLVNQTLQFSFTGVANPPSVSITGQGPTTILDCGSVTSAIAAFNVSTISVANMAIQNCVGTSLSQEGGMPSGGALHFIGGGGDTNVNITEMTFSGNQADMGGAVYLHYSGAGVVNAVISSSTFSNNSCAIAGGGAYAGKISNLTVANCVFIGNTGGAGAGLSVNEGRQASITGNLFERNVGAGGGGAALVPEAGLVVHNNTFVGNNGTVGGGLFVGSPALIDRNVFLDNHANDTENTALYGGNLALGQNMLSISPAAAPPFTVRDSIIEKGIASAGGGLVMLNSSVTITSTVFRNNIAYRICSAAIGIQLKQAIVSENVTLVSNPGQGSLTAEDCMTLADSTLPPPGAPVSVLPPAPLPPQLQPPATLVRDATTSPSPAALSATAPDNMPTAAVAGGAAAGGVLLVAVVGFAAWWFKHRTRRPQHGIGDTPTCSKANSGLEDAVTLQVAPADSMEKQGIAGTDTTTSASTQLPATGTIGRSAKGTYRTSTLGSASSQTGGSSQLVAIESQPSALTSEEQAAYERETLNRLQIAWSSIELGKVLGAGGFGTVYKGMWKDLTVAVKMLSVDSLSSRAQASLRQEALAMCELRHPAIAHIYGLVDDGEHCALVMKYYRHGALSAAMSNAQYLGLELVQRVRMALQVASGMSALHERGFIHGDLKTSNLLVELDGSVVITDFGLAVVSGERVASGAMTVQISPPEVLRNPSAPRTKAGDVYAFGIVLLEIVTGRFCYTGMPRDMIKRVVLAGQRPGIPPHLPPTIIEIVQACWAQEPEERPTFDHVMSQLSKVVRSEGIQRADAGADAAEGPDVLHHSLYNSTPVATTTSVMWPFRD